MCEEFRGFREKEKMISFKEAFIAWFDALIDMPRLSFLLMSVKGQIAPMFVLVLWIIIPFIGQIDIIIDNPLIYILVGFILFAILSIYLTGKVIIESKPESFPESHKGWLEESDKENA